MTSKSDPLSDSAGDPAPPSREFGIHIDGDALVLPSGCKLPQKCVLTNQPVAASDMIFVNLGWTPNSASIWAVLGAPFLFLSYIANRQLCEITYGLNRKRRIKNIVFTLLKILACVGFFAATLAIAAIPTHARITTPLMWACFILFLLSVVAIFVGHSPLRVVKYEDGMFWVKGFSQAFLDDLEL